MGDRHVYGAKSRFMTQAVLACMEAEVFGETASHEAIAGYAEGVASTSAARLRGMWTCSSRSR